MFPTCSEWQKFVCPYLKTNDCQRPYCPFSHTTSREKLRHHTVAHRGQQQTVEQSAQSDSLPTDLLVAKTKASKSGKVRLPTYKPTPIVELKRRQELRQQRHKCKSGSAKVDVDKNAERKIPTPPPEPTTKVDVDQPNVAKISGLTFDHGEDGFVQAPVEDARQKVGKEEISTDMVVIEADVSNDVQTSTVKADDTVIITELFGSDSDDNAAYIRRAPRLRRSKKLTLSDSVITVFPASSALPSVADGRDVAATEQRRRSDICLGAVNKASLDGRNRLSFILSTDIPLSNAVKDCDVKETNDSAAVVDNYETVMKKQKRISRLKPAESGDQERPKVAFDPRCRISTCLRQRYLDLFFDEYLKHCADRQQAISSAIKEESDLLGSVATSDGYKVAAVNRLQRIRCGTVVPKVPEKIVKVFDAMAFYQALSPYLLTEEQLKRNAYPFSDGCDRAIYHNESVAKLYRPDNDLRRTCCRCGITFYLTPSGEYAPRNDECVHHFAKAYRRHASTGIVSRYSCCGGALNSTGCSIEKVHVTEMLPESELDGYIQLNSLGGKPNTVYGVDCEMVYTSMGQSLARVTVIDMDLNVVYDRVVNPSGQLADCNSRFSGLTKEMVLNANASLRDVQKDLLATLHESSVLIGHSLENDLRALKIIHHNVVDTSLVFPHRLGHPCKRSLKSLAADHLKKIIQEADTGHDSAEDAAVCVELMKWKVAQDYC